MLNVDGTLKIFGENILILIRQNGWTITEAARQLRYGRNDLSLIINGTKNFQLKTAVRFAKIFNISVFLLFSRQFDDSEYRERFPFIEENYMEVFAQNFREFHLKQAMVELDSATMSKIMNGKYQNPTIKTLCTIGADTTTSVSALLKTHKDKQIELKIKGGTT